jgi:hypothetical protein
VPLRRKHDLLPADQERPIDLDKLPRALRRDERWPLWRELIERRAELLGERPHEPPWTPLRFSQHREANTIVFAFDRRLADKTVRAALERELPRLRAKGWLVASQPLSKRELALVRHVCLDSPIDASWRERAKGWRRSRFCRIHPKWAKRYRGKKAARRFEKDFHKAETRLAGRSRALGVHYDPQVRERQREIHSQRELLGMAAAEPLPIDDAAARGGTIARVDPARAESVRAHFAAAAKIEELVAKALAGDAAAADEAVALCLRYRPAAVDELHARLGRVRQDKPGDSGESNHAE